jgi:hypothetical protein
MRISGTTVPSLVPRFGSRSSGALIPLFSIEFAGRTPSEDIELIQTENEEHPSRVRVGMSKHPASELSTPSPSPATDNGAMERVRVLCDCTLVPVSFVDPVSETKPDLVAAVKFGDLSSTTAAGLREVVR